MRWHSLPDTGFEIWALAVWGRARYLSVTEAPHNTEFYTGMGKKPFCFFQTAETGNRTLNSSVKGSGANHYPRAPARWADTTCSCRFTSDAVYYGIRRSLNGLCSITEVKQCRARFIIGWVTAWDCQVLYTLVGLREPRKSDGSSVWLWVGRKRTSMDVGAVSIRRDPKKSTTWSTWHIYIRPWMISWMITGLAKLLPWRDSTIVRTAT